MSEGAAMTEAGDAVEAAPSRDEVIASLEQRVRRLEEALATVQDTRQLEERVVERLIRAAPPAQPVTAAPPPASTGLLLDVGRRLLPAAVDAVKAEANAAEAQARAGAPPLRRSWLVFDLVAEARVMVRMFVDPRYRMTWACRLVLPVLAGLLFISWWQLGSIPLLGALLDKVMDVLLAFMAYKILAREVGFYRDRIPDAPIP